MMLSKRKILKPKRIRLEASTACQLKCPSCPTASGETHKKLGVGFLKFYDFKNFLDKNPRLSRIELSNWGEIFLNKELIEIMKYAYEHRVSLSADNGVNLNNATKEVLRALVRYKFKRITCSIDGASQEIYSLYRIKGNFEQVVENIKTLNAFKTEYKSPYPLLKWQFIAFGHNEHEITQARKLARELGMTFYLKLSWEDLYTESFSPVKDTDLIRKETGLSVANRIEFKERYGEEYMKCCLSLWTYPQINYDGRVLGCSVNFWGDYGNAFKYGLEKCLNNEKINYAREMLMGKRQRKKDIPCNQCNIYKNMEENSAWLKKEDIREGFAKNRAYTLIDKSVLGFALTEQWFRLEAAVRHRLKRRRSSGSVRSMFTNNIKE